MTREALLASLAEAVAQRRLRPLDLALARFLAECDAAAPPVLLLLAALLSRQLADGHLCLDLRALDTLADQHDWPAPWRALLAQPPAPSPLLADACGLPAEAPLVLDDHRLYLRRYWNHERAVAQGIRTRLALPPRPAASLRDELDRLFPSTADGGLAWPRIACALAARGAFAVITGGPGTGKTTTVVRLLGLLQTLQQREDRPLLRIRLAAPTGKAAARLNASIAAQRARLELDTAVREAIPAQVDTLHRLLGARTDDRGFRHGPDHPLHLDVLVIDEASMVDLELMAAVLAALPPTAKLILLGDKDQLASVEAGAVLGDLCQRADAGHYDDATVAWLSQAGCGDVRAWASDDARPLDQQVAMLRQSHRFDAESGIGRLAAAVNAGDAAAAMALLESDRDDLGWLAAAASPAQLAAMAVDGRFRPAGTAPSPQAPSGYRRYLEQLRRTRPGDHDGDAAFAAWAQRVLLAFGDFQLLCALRHGPCGTLELNHRIAAALRAAALVDADQGWYEGRPVMVTRNDYRLGLMNGDVGIALRRPSPDGVMRLYVAFPDAAADTGVRFVLPSRLDDVDTVYAMTVHKSQGSEFAHAALVLPAEPSGALTRELLYTAVTRARRRFSLAGTRASLERAVVQRTWRHSGLAQRLLASPMPSA